MRKAVLIVCGGLLQVPAVEAARDLGLAVVVTDANVGAPAMALADEAVQLDIYDVEGHRRLVDELRVRYDLVGVFAEGADVEVTVAAAAAHAGLPGIPVESALNTKNKARARRCLDAVPGANPRWAEVATVAEAIAAAAEVGYPLVAKPADNCASRGTTRVADPAALEAAVEAALAASTTGTALLEELLVGTEQSVELLFDADGNVHRLNIVDRPFLTEGDYAIELGHVNPTALDEASRDRLYALVERAAAATGVRFGAFKADTIWTADGPRILEVTARLSGGFDCQKTTPLASGRDFIRAALRLAVGLPLDPDDLSRTVDRHAVAWTAFPSPGRVTSIGDLDGVLRMPGIAEVLLRVGVGDVVSPYVDCGARPVFVIAVGGSREEALANAQAGADALAITTEPVAA